MSNSYHGKMHIGMYRYTFLTIDNSSIQIRINLSFWTQRQLLGNFKSVICNINTFPKSVNL